MKRIVLIGFAVLVLAAGTGYAMMGSGMMGGGQSGRMGGGQRGPAFGGDMLQKEMMIDVMQMMKDALAIQKDMLRGMIDTEKEQNIIKLSSMMRDLDRMSAALGANQ